MKLNAKNNPAVSPVIGTILLVAITVVLVAIIAAVVMGMSSSVGNTKDVGLTVDTADYQIGGYWYTNVQVMIYGGKDVNDLVYLNVSVEGAKFAVYLDPGFITKEGYFDPAFPKEIISNPVGVPLYYTPYPVTDGETIQYVDALVTVTGTFTDGTTQVLLTRTLTFPTEMPQSLRNIGVRYFYDNEYNPQVETGVEQGWLLESPVFK